MTFLKYLTIGAIFMAVSVSGNYNYSTKFINDINDVVLVKKSDTCVILVVDDKIKFVSTEGDAPKQLAKHRNVIKGKNLEIVKATFIPLSTTDVVEKLAKIGEHRDTFLVYFTTAAPAPKGSITVKTKKPVGLVGNLLSTLGLNVGESGLLSGLLDLLGIETTVSKVTTVDF